MNLFSANCALRCWARGPGQVLLESSLRYTGSHAWVPGPSLVRGIWHFHHLPGGPAGFVCLPLPLAEGLFSRVWAVQPLERFLSCGHSWHLSGSSLLVALWQPLISKHVQGQMLLSQMESFSRRTLGHVFQPCLPFPKVTCVKFRKTLRGANRREAFPLHAKGCFWGPICLACRYSFFCYHSSSSVMWQHIQKSDCPICCFNP